MPCGRVWSEARGAKALQYMALGIPRAARRRREFGNHSGGVMVLALRKRGVAK